MLKKHTHFLLFLLTLAFHLPLQAQVKPYWVDSTGDMVRSGYDKCWRNSNWSSSTALAECEGGMKKPADSDKDGVMDSKDKCPGTAAGIKVDATGCAKDSDGDGAADSYDRCPGTPRGVSVDATGCPTDSDGDGVADNNDKCPGTAQGVKVDASGCPIDSDGDGIADSNDKCPGTAQGVKVDASGCDINKDDDGDGIANRMDSCPGSAPGAVVDGTGCDLKADIRLNNVQFKTGTANLDAQSKNILNRVAATLNANPHLKFEVAGHTDNTGNYQSNVNLSESRAKSVRQYLIDNGVSASRLTARGYGPDKPVASNDTRNGRSLNRRVELVLQ